MKNLLFLSLIFPSLLFADIKLPKVISDHMVLQRGQEVPIWGWAAPRERIRLEFQGQSYRTRATKEGRWKIVLPAMEAGGPFEMKLKGKNEIMLKDILIGEVWICSGQSNMEWPVQASNDPKNEIAAANYPNIRLFKVGRDVQFVPLDDVQVGEWAACSPNTVASFSAVGYFFGRKLHKDFEVPIGLIQSAWGGTIVETWTSKESIMEVPGFEKSTDHLNAETAQKLAVKAEKRYQEILAEAEGQESGIINGQAIWARNDLNDGKWKTMALPTLWEQVGYEGLDGYVWFRKTIELTETQAASAQILELGPIDDTDITWVNGKQVGTMVQQYNAPRSYEVDKGVFRPGKNVITVRVHDTGGGGGIYGSPKQMRLQTGEGDISLAGSWKFRISPKDMRVNLQVMGPNDAPTLLYNGMIHGLIPYAIKGAIWYQGESNAGRAYQYRTLFKTLIKDWRGKWGYDLDFHFVQLANFMQAMPEPGESNWAELREAQNMALELPNTGVAVTIDIGEADDIHPRNKQDVGKRLALSAEHSAYDMDIVYSGPMYKGLEVKGKRAYVTFDHVGSGLMANDKYGYIKGFTIAGSDRKFHWAKAFFQGDKVVVYSSEVDKPVAVRYAWANNPDDANLYNQEGLPASPFRTDDWEGITYGKK